MFVPNTASISALIALSVCAPIQPFDSSFGSDIKEILEFLSHTHHSAEVDIHVCASSSNLVKVLGELRPNPNGTYQIAIGRLSQSNFTSSCMTSAIGGSTYSGLPKMIIVVFPETLAELRQFLAQLSKFYSSSADRWPTVKVFVAWPSAATSWEKDAEALLKSTLPLASLDSHLYVFPRIAGSLFTTWEFYSIRDVRVFQRVNGTIDYVSRVIRRGNFKGAVLRGLVQKEDYASRIVQFEMVNNTAVVVGGVAIEIFRSLSASLNFSIKYVNGNGWIEQAENGSVVGMGTQLLNNEADMIASFSEVLLYRVQTFSPSRIIHTRAIEAFISKPDTSSYRNILLQSFQPLLWLAVAASAAMVYVSVAIVATATNRILQPNGRGLVDRREILLYLMSAFCFQAKHSPRMTTTLQIILLVTLMTTVVYNTVYAASIIAVFSVEVNPLKSADDLVSKGFIFYGNRVSFKGLQYAEKQAEYQGVDPSSREIEIEEAIVRMNQSRSAFISVRNSFLNAAVRNYSIREICSRITAVKFNNDSQVGVLYYRKFEPIKKFIDYHLGLWKERGLLGHYREIYDPIASHRCDPPRKQIRGLTAIELRSAYAVLIFGAGSCVLVLSVEFCIAWWKRVVEHRDKSWQA